MKKSYTVPNLDVVMLEHIDLITSSDPVKSALGLFPEEDDI